MEFAVVVAFWSGTPFVTLGLRVSRGVVVKRWLFDSVLKDHIKVEGERLKEGGFD